MLDFRNINTLWASVLVETLVQSGLKTVIISPGSRSTPLTVAFARHPRISAIPILDERSASFFALGHAKASGQAPVLVCTSGTAGANYFPAIIEAYESLVPLLVLTADRPPELRHCASGQTIDQQKLYGRYVQFYSELSIPESSLSQLRYLRQSVAQAWQRCHHPIAGPVHLNCPFRDPLAPVIDDQAPPLAPVLDDAFFQHLEVAARAEPLLHPRAEPVAAPAHSLQGHGLPGQTERGLIIAGPVAALSPQRYCEAIAALSKTLGWPVLADGLSPLRNWSQTNPYLISTYELLLRQTHHAEALVPEQVIQVGPLPTSKILRQWLAHHNPLRWIVDKTGRNRDPLHGSTVFLSLSVAELTRLLSQLLPSAVALSSYGKAWCDSDRQAQQRLKAAMEPLAERFEAKLSWLLPTLLPPRTPVMIANSMPVRDVEWFWPPNNTGITPYFSRGANGIEGTLSTALGIAQHHQKAVLLTGDLALLHDSNGFLNVANRSVHLTILLINNQGGGIFETLSIAQAEADLFEDFFATPQAVSFQALATAHGVDYERILSWEDLAQRLRVLPNSGVRLLELRCDRKKDARLRATLLDTIGRFDGDVLS